ncbi:GNAT family N-acetyltransferase [Olivibacter sp. SDN3]|uniref:GNAT family N-acetyltransferase n=1 Tax=Olivibacter sp. SDN3 TaxID=2764720 RepID=UPI001650E48D|nr:GNAT family N-acetyltransferase [Olivibacter sp. SDN3]QNL52318.1 GNAT family N-acetyltransferase [Olivibacter sp. SDN3]
MYLAQEEDKEIVIDILLQSFRNNKSVHYIVKQDEQLNKRLRYLMSYSFDLCFHFGKVLLSDRKDACALITYPHRKKNLLKSIRMDIGLLINTIGIFKLGKAIKREALIKANYPVQDFLYLWFIGVKPHMQGQGVGSDLLNQVLQEAKATHLDVHLETSTLTNLPWYRKFGFEIYKELDFGYTLHMLRWRKEKV